MKVAYILRPDSDRVYGGDSAVMAELAAALSELGVETVVARQVEIGPPGGFDLLHIMSMAPVGHVRAMFGWAQAGDVAVVCSPLYWSDFRDWYERAIVGVPHWRYLARVLGKRRAWSLYRRFQYARTPRDLGWQVNRAGLVAADAVATTSRWENTWLAGHFRLPPEVRARMAIAPFGIDHRRYGQTFTPAELAEFRARYGLPEGYVCQVARIEEKKNQLAVIRALYDTGIPLVFVGARSPYYAADYPDRCYELGRARGNTHFLGFVPQADLPRLYAAAAAHILPSWHELPGLSSLEAGACGSRIISTSVSPLPQMLGDLAWYVDPFDDASIRQAVVKALASPVPPALRPRLLSEFTWPIAAQANLALYDGIIRARHETRAKHC